MLDPSQPYKNVDGVNINLTPEERSDREAEESAWASGAAKREALKQITALESAITQRRLREALLGTDNGWLANVNSQIATLRSSL